MLSSDSMAPHIESLGSVKHPNDDDTVIGWLIEDADILEDSHAEFPLAFEL
jgi:hypothetical protein